MPSGMVPVRELHPRPSSLKEDKGNAPRKQARVLYATRTART
jgi:hypothetical protein